MFFHVLPKKDRIYVAGALNSDACGYIENLSRMTKWANKIQRMGYAVFSPGNDFIQGLVDGRLTYDHYFNNSMELLRSADAMFVVPKSEDSEGVAREISIANDLNIPILDTKSHLEQFMNRPKILAIVGESGTGKTTIAEMIEDNYNIPMIESHTDRPKRSPDEKGHTFHTSDEYDRLSKEDMIAWTNFGNNRYCCLKEDVEDENTYVIDERGILMLEHQHKARYNIYKLRVKRSIMKRRQYVTNDRIERDEDAFWLPNGFYDALMINDGDLTELTNSVEKVVDTFF